MLQKIIDSVNSIALLSEEEHSEFVNILDVKHVKKKDFALREGEICDKIVYIHSGVLRLFYDKDGVENTTSFCLEDCWFTDFESYLTGKRTQVNLQAMEDTTIIKFRKSAIEKLYLKYHNVERIGRILVEQAFVKMIEESRLVNSETPEERYLKLIHQRPELFQRIPQQYIASFLNIQPESLSRIRKRISLRHQLS